MYNEKSKENLVSISDRSPEERSEIGRKGAIAAAEAKRRKRKIREAVSDLIYRDVDITNEFFLETDFLGQEKPVYTVKDYKPDTVIDAIALTLINDALSGNMRSIRLIVDALGVEED